MKNTASYLKGLGGIAMVGLFVLVLGSFLIPFHQVKAEVLLVTCSTETQSGVTGTILTDSTSCSIPSGSNISRALLNYTLDDGGEIYVNGQQVVAIAPDPGTDSTSMDIPASLFSPGASFLVKVVARNALDSSGNPSGQVYGQATVRVYASDVQNPTPTVHLSANPNSVAYGGASTLSWTSTNATSCSASGGWSGSKGTSGSSSTGALFNTTTFNITCTNSTGSASDSATVSVGGQQNPSVSVILTANPDNISAGDNSILTWSSTNATSCVASGGRNGWSGSRVTSGHFDTQALYDTTTYSITCTNNTGGSASDSETVFVDDNNNNNGNVRVTISADRTNIGFNEGTTIRWYPRDADSCTGERGTNGWSGRKSTRAGTFYTGPLSRTTTFEITCENGNDEANDSVTVSVGGNIVAPPVAQALTAITQPATAVTSGSAQLNGLILNASNSYLNNSTNAWFEWGTTSSLGNRTPATLIGALPSVKHASFITGLSSGRTYYFRVVAENSYSRNVGAILSFTTTGRGVVVTPTRTGTALILVNSSIDRSQPIVPTLDNSRPKPGDEINYTVNYQNVGTAAVTNAVLQLNLPFEVDYMFSTPNNPTISGNTLVFNIGTIRANSQGVVTVRVRVRDNIPIGTNLNFPATLSYVDPSGQPQSVSANVTAQVWDEASQSFINLGANVFGAGFFPDNVFGWLLVILLILALIMLVKYLLTQPFTKKTTIITDQPLSKKTTTTMVEH